MNPDIIDAIAATTVMSSSLCVGVYLGRKIHDHGGEVLRLFDSTIAMVVSFGMMWGEMVAYGQLLKRADPTNAIIREERLVEKNAKFYERNIGNGVCVKIDRFGFADVPYQRVFIQDTLTNATMRYFSAANRSEPKDCRETTNTNPFQDNRKALFTEVLAPAGHPFYSYSKAKLDSITYQAFHDRTIHRPDANCFVEKQ